MQHIADCQAMPFGNTHVMPSCLTHGSLFSGIGGFDLAAKWMNWINVFQCEKDEWCRKVLAKNFPDTKRYADIKEFNAKEFYGTVDVISGGFPCQPFSTAGRRKGETDDRYLWPEMLRIIGEVKPTFVVGENVAGLLSMENGKTLDKICLDLENEGYQIELFVIPACGVGAWHRRDRVWIIAHSCNSTDSRNTRTLQGKNGQGRIQEREQLEQPVITNKVWTGQVFPNATGVGQSGQGQYKQPINSETNGEGQTDNAFSISKRKQWATEPELGRVANGIPDRVDRLKGLGNAIVPQVAFELFKAVESVHRHGA